MHPDGGGATRDMPTTSDDTLKRRVELAEQALRASGIDALVLYATGSVLGNQSQTNAYLRYLCNFDGHNLPALLVLCPGHPPALFTGTRFHVRPRLAESRLWFKDVHHVAPRELGDHAVALLKERIPAAKKIAIIGYDETPAPVWASLQAGLPGVAWVHDFAPQIDRHRVCKSAGELTFHRKAAAACDAMFETLARTARSGKAGFQLKAAMEHTAHDLGCGYCDTWLTAAPQADAFRYHMDECQRVPQPGDQLLAGIMLTYEGHWGHSVRTGSVGAAAPEHRKLYDICREMFDAALDGLRPGADLHGVNDAMDDVPHRYYTDDQVQRTRAGHGLGFAYEDPVASAAFPNAWEPKIRESNPGRDRKPIEARPGMLLELHPHLFVPGVGGAMIGDMVLVTESGHEILTHYPRDLIAW
jgi:Xaa-Pro aminopeptidase